jgi:plasmid stability protein
MTKTTIYLPDDLKQAIARIASASGRSEAEVIRDALRTMVRGAGRPRPRGALFTSGDPFLSERVDEALAGFGQR